MWMQRPLPQHLLTYAADDVAQLVSLAEAMTSQLGTSLVAHVLTLSDVYAQSYWDAEDKDTQPHRLAGPC